MKHLGDITKINGAEIELVDVIVGGSPCQDLSVAGNRAGLDGERSGLFMEQIRIVREQRNESIKRADNPIRPRYMVWENVPGAFSSNKAEDFRTVLEETARIADGDAVIPRPPKGKWATAGCIMGDGWSIAWRVLDAQFWGVPQRRRRIALVADFGGHTAPEILFERKSVSGDIAESGTEREGIAGAAAGGVGTTEYLTGWDNQEKRIFSDRGVSPTLSGSDGGGGRTVCGYVLPSEPVTYPGVGITSKQNASKGTPGVCHTLNQDSRNYVVSDRPAVFSFDSLSSNSMKSSNPHSGCRQVEVAKRIDTTNPDPSKNQGGMAVLFEPRSQDGVPRIHDEICPTLNTAQGGQRQPCVAEPIALDRAAYNLQNTVRTHQSVRRLTPLECERLQGFPDNWTNIPPQANVTEEDLAFWRTVWDEWQAMEGKKPKTDKQIIKWLQSEPADSARYKALGDSIALPPWRFVLGRIYQHGARTLGSLFDGIGGFPLIWSELPDTATLWASEIEPFRIAVTTKRLIGG